NRGKTMGLHSLEWWQYTTTVGGNPAHSGPARFIFAGFWITSAHLGSLLFGSGAFRPAHPRFSAFVSSPCHKTPLQEVSNAHASHLRRSTAWAIAPGAPRRGQG